MDAKGMTSKMRGYLSIIPFLGPLFHCTIENHRDAIKEFLIALLFSTSTFWLTAIILRGMNVANPVEATYSSGQLFIFAVGFVGPLLGIIIDDPRNARQFPGKTNHILLLVLILLVSGVLYAIQIAGNRGILNHDHQWTVEVSLYAAAAATILRYLSILYRKSTIDAERELKDPESAFAAAFVRRHSGSGELK